MSSATTLLEALQAVPARIQDYPDHTIEFASGWFDAVEQTRSAIELAHQFSTLTDYPMWLRISNRIYGQRDFVYYLIGADRVGKEYGNGFTECCEHIVSELHKSIAG